MRVQYHRAWAWAPQESSSTASICCQTCHVSAGNAGVAAPPPTDNLSPTSTASPVSALWSPCILPEALSGILAPLAASVGGGKTLEAMRVASLRTLTQLEWTGIQGRGWGTMRGLAGVQGRRCACCLALVLQNILPVFQHSTNASAATSTPAGASAPKLTEKEIVVAAAGLLGLAQEWSGIGGGGGGGAKDGRFEKASVVLQQHQSAQAVWNCLRPLAVRETLGKGAAAVCVLTCACVLPQIQRPHPHACTYVCVFWRDYVCVIL